MKHACFISYCHGQDELTNTFISQLEQALQNELGQRMDEKIYIDRTRLKPGFWYHEALAQAICESVSMVVVYSPRYMRHDYCVREFEGMKWLEQKRRDLLGGMWPQGRGMIIPVIFRGDPPKAIKAYRHYCDFTKFTLADTRICENPKYVDEIGKMAEVIHQNFLLFEKAKKAEIDLCGGCDKSRLPLISEIPWWQPGSEGPLDDFPSRESQP